MPLVFGGVAVGFLVLLTAVALLGMHRTAGTLVRALLNGFGEQRGFRKWFFRAIGLTALARATAWVVRRVRQVISNAAAANLEVVQLWLRDLSAVAHFTYKELGEIAPSWAQHFGVFRYRTMPTAITAKTAPIAVAARQAGALAGRSISVGKANRIRVGRSIDRLRRQMGLLAGILLGIDVLVRGRNAQDHHRVHTRDIPQIRDRDIPGLKAGARAVGKEVADHRSRLKRLEKALGLGVVGLVVYRILARVAPWLFCRNWKRLGRAICGMNPNALTSLIGLLLTAFALSDLRRTAKLSQDALVFATDTIWKAARIGDRPKGRFTID